MKTAVIYARYSSDKQTEQSIEGQLYDCKEYASRNDIQIVGEYIDRAMTGRSDDRPQFQKMIEDSKVNKWDYVLVWKLDRFSRDTYDNAVYKRILRKNGVKVLSAMENFSDDPNGQMLEHILESVAEYYSADLRDKTKRGMHQSALKCESTGHIPIGYTVQNKKYVIDENTRYIPETVFRRYADGDKLSDIANDLNTAGYRTKKGHKFTCNSFYTMLSSRKYIGVYSYDGVEIPNGMPALVSEDIFNKVQDRLKDNRKRAAKFHTKADYVLSGKLICTECQKPMTGESSYSRKGDIYYYYRCKHHRIRKEVIENDVNKAICDQLLKLDIDVLTERIQAAFKQLSDTSNICAVKAEIADTDKQSANIVNAIAASGGNPLLIQKLNELSERKKALETEYARLQSMQYIPSRADIEKFINQIGDNAHKMVSHVYVGDGDEMRITFDKFRSPSPLGSQSQNNRNSIAIFDGMLSIVSSRA